ncbi:MAG: hypothetical protein CFE31_10400 [Rhizobiales bacterium PAR1]|nr:MAG: hypothetical protein CFE31_10400 [Rhizobiales bacterium PAR1]
MWCWRCKTEMPMLDEEEFTQLHAFAENGQRRSFWHFFKQPSAIERSLNWQRLWCSEYERITGHKESNPNVIWHHRVSLHGPPCATCGKPLRTPQAKLCAFCGSAAAAAPEERDAAT